MGWGSTRHDGGAISQAASANPVAASVQGAEERRHAAGQNSVISAIRVYGVDRVRPMRSTFRIPSTVSASMKVNTLNTATVTRQSTWSFVAVRLGAKKRLTMSLEPSVGLPIKRAAAVLTPAAHG